MSSDGRDTHVMVLADGRDLAWMDLGDCGGVPVFVFHGTPGSRLQVAFGDDTARAAGVRLLVPDRPGFGLSTYQPGRRLAGWAADVAELADHLGLTRFAVLGVSGGGPHAAACARLLPHRVSAAGIVSGVGPLAEPGSDAGMTPYDALAFRLARRSPRLVVPLAVALTAMGRRHPERALAMTARELGPPDVAVLQRADVRDAFLADVRRWSPTTGKAVAQEYGLFARDWGFRLEDITVPVHLWHGDADRDVPIIQAHHQAKAIPGSVLHECPGEGHLLVVARFEEILRVVTAAAAAS